MRLLIQVIFTWLFSVCASGKLRVHIMQTQRKLDGSTDVQLILTSALDRELRDLYEVKVVAYDGGSPPRSGTVDVTVTVTDANDNGPVFEYNSYEVSVDENIDVGTTVAKVTAFDADDGINAQVSNLLMESLT